MGLVLGGGFSGFGPANVGLRLDRFFTFWASASMMANILSTPMLNPTAGIGDPKIPTRLS